MTVPAETILKAESLCKRYPAQNGEPAVFEDFHLSLAPGESVALFGPNGAGKTTLLDIIAGLISRTTGRLETSLSPREISYIRQDYRGNLLPWFTVIRNITLPLVLRGVPQNEAASLAEDLAAELGISLPMAKYPYQLSGGQQQAVGILRGLLPRPRLLILDEIFSSLDYRAALSMREKISGFIAESRLRSGTAALLVSHDLEAALFLADRLLVLSPRPMRVIREIKVNLPWPRTGGMLLRREFMEAREEALKAACGGDL